jgi:ubiquinone/menaquinone biosynthesis C-methylase UbiE
LLDPVPRHVAEAQALALSQAQQPFEAALGDARRLDEPADSFDVVLLMGPLYHLVERADRVLALQEARRAVRSTGQIVAVAVSRFVSLLDGLHSEWLSDPKFRAMVEQDL